MLKSSNITSISVRKIAISLLLIGVTVFGFASIGGGRKSKVGSLKAEFTPIRVSSGFTLRSKPNYRGSLILKEEKFSNYIAYNSLITYQKGNSTYILPNKYK